MTMDKKETLEQQIAKLTEVIDALEKNFPEEEFVDEISFISIVKDKLADHCSE